MSDDYPAYYNAWKQVMGEPENRLICAWHILHSWKKNYNLIKSQTKREEVNKIMRNLLTETDEFTFKRLMNQTIKHLIEDNETKNFGNYFKDYYSHRIEVWAYCFRKNLGINTNMYLENLHKRIKYIYMNGKQVKRMDHSLDLILKLVYNMMFERMINLEKGSVSTKIQRIRESHKKSDEMKSEITIYKQDHWLVHSESDTYYYDIKSKSKQCQCELRCDKCEVCIHNYTCNCHDYLIRNNLCKHIHYLIKNVIKKNNVSIQLSIKY